MTSPACSTAVFSRLPIPNKSPRSSPSESAEGPAVRSRSRGLSSGGSCFIVYLRRPIFSPLIPTNTVLLKYTAREREREAHHVGVVALDCLWYWHAILHGHREVDGRLFLSHLDGGTASEAATAAGRVAAGHGARDAAQEPADSGGGTAAHLDLLDFLCGDP